MGRIASPLATLAPISSTGNLLFTRPLYLDSMFRSIASSVSLVTEWSDGKQYVFVAPAIITVGGGDGERRSVSSKRCVALELVHFHFAFTSVAVEQ